MVFKIQWKPFWRATQLYPQSDRAGLQVCVNHGVFAQAPLACPCYYLDTLPVVKQFLDFLLDLVLGKMPWAGKKKEGNVFRWWKKRTEASAKR